MTTSARMRRKQKTSSIAVIIEEPQWRRECPGIARFLRRAARAALSAAGAPKGSRLTLLLAGDERLKELNRLFRGKKAATNVLSFPAEEAGYLGDVAMAFGVTAREAAAARKRFHNHAAHLAVHGVLHLLGFDHTRAHDAETMEDLERRILSGLGIADPYAAAEVA